MSSHLFVRSVVFERNSEGQWAVSRVNTNKGKFRIAQDLNDELFSKEEKDVVERFMSHIVTELKEPLEEFVVQEEEEEKRRNEKE